MCHDGAPAPIEALQAAIAEAVEAASVIYGVAEAVEWADGFEFSQDALDSDLRCFRAAGLNFKTMVERRLSTLKGNRHNHARISKLDSSNPEIRLLLDLADGMRVPRPDGFVPNGKSELSPLRPSYLRVAGAVNKMIADIFANKLGCLLPKALAIVAERGREGNTPTPSQRWPRGSMKVTLPLLRRSLQKEMDLPARLHYPYIYVPSRQR